MVEKFVKMWYKTLLVSDKSKFVIVDNMEWFNVFGLIFIAVIMIPNVVFAIKCKDGFMLYLRLSAKMDLIISGTINMLRSLNK